MADISNTDDIISVSDIIERVEELREQRRQKYVSGWNMPGYLPDSDPAEFDDADDARQSIINAMDEEADSLEHTEEAENAPAIEELRRASLALLRCNDEGAGAGYGRTIGRFHYWIKHEGFTGLDEDEAQELATLEKLLEELQGYGGNEQWEGNWYPSQLIRDSHFQDYAEKLAEEIGAINPNAGWPNNCIDWEKAARELQYDYSSVDSEGEAYYYRN